MRARTRDEHDAHDEECGPLPLVVAARVGLAAQRRLDVYADMCVWTCVWACAANCTPVDMHIERPSARADELQEVHARMLRVADAACEARKYIMRPAVGALG